MRTKLLPAALLAILTVTSLSACSPELLGPSSDSPGLGSDGAGSLADPASVDSAIAAGTWTNPGGGTVEPIDTGTYVPADTGTSGTSGTSIELTFQTSGAARLGEGTCGPKGRWTFNGVTSGPNSPNCLAYLSGNEAGINGKGSCTVSAQGYPGLWLNPAGHPTTPNHTNCLPVGPSSTTLALTFPGQTVLYQANDGSGRRILDFRWNGETLAQLTYQGGAQDVTSGAGVLATGDNATPSRIWTIDFAQPALNQSGTIPNGDLTAALIDAGVQVVACNTAAGCSLVMLRVQ